MTSGRPRLPPPSLLVLGPRVASAVGGLRPLGSIFGGTFSALAIGDTLDYSIQRHAVIAYGEIDEIVSPAFLTVLAGLVGEEGEDPFAAAAEEVDASEEMEASEVYTSAGHFFASRIPTAVHRTSVTAHGTTTEILLIRLQRGPLALGPGTKITFGPASKPGHGEQRPSCSKSPDALGSCEAMTQIFGLFSEKRRVC